MKCFIFSKTALEHIEGTDELLSKCWRSGNTAPISLPKEPREYLLDNQSEPKN